MISQAIEDRRTGVKHGTRTRSLQNHNLALCPVELASLHEKTRELDLNQRPANDNNPVWLAMSQPFGLTFSHYLPSKARYAALPSELSRVIAHSEHRRADGEVGRLPVPIRYVSNMGHVWEGLLGDAEKSRLEILAPTAHNPHMTVLPKRAKWTYFSFPNFNGKRKAIKIRGFCREHEIIQVIHAYRQHHHVCLVMRVTIIPNRSNHTTVYKSHSWAYIEGKLVPTEFWGPDPSELPETDRPAI